MIALIMFSFILYKKNYYIKPKQTEYEIVDEFGFQNNGFYLININSNGTDKYTIYIATKSNIEKYQKDYNLSVRFLCDSQGKIDNHHIIQIQNRSTKITGNIKQKGHYKIIVQSCTYPNQECYINMFFKNPNSYLSTEDQECMYIFLIFSMISFIILIFWVINWIYFISLKNKIHLMFSLFLFISFIENFLTFNDFYIRHKSDDVNLDSIYIMYFKSISQFIYLFTMTSILFGLGLFFESIYNIFHFLNILFNFFISLIKSQVDYNIIFQKKYEVIFSIFKIFKKQPYSIIVNSCFFVSSIWDEILFFGFKSNYNDNFKYNDKNGYYFVAYFVICANIFSTDIFRFIIVCLNTSNRILLYIAYTINICFTILLAYQLRLRKGVIDNYMKMNMKIYNYDFSKSDKIPNNKFSGDPIKSIVIPSQIVEIGEKVFMGCENLEKVDFQPESKLKKIGSFCFSNTKIENIVIPSHVKKIENNVFNLCRSLKKVDFTEDSELMVIEKNAFYHSSINKLTIPSNVAYLNDGWCQLTPNLNKINLSPNNQYFSYINNSFIIGKKNNCGVLYFARRNIKKVEISSLISQINPHCFSCCKYLHKVSFEKNSKLKAIHDFAFSVSSIFQITIPKSVSKIGKFAFGNCIKLKKVNFEFNSKLNIIDQNAFYNTSIKRIEIPSKVAIIGKSAFSKCKRLKSITFERKSQLKIIEDNAFTNSSITSFCFPSKVVRIGKDIFNNCKKLQIVEIPKQSYIFMNFNHINDFNFASNTIIMVHL